MQTSVNDKLLPKKRWPKNCFNKKNYKYLRQINILKQNKIMDSLHPFQLILRKNFYPVPVYSAVSFSLLCPKKEELYE
jgi:hypothetical protein